MIDVRKMLRWIKSRGGVNLTTYAQLCERDKEDPVQWITWPQLVEVTQKVTAELDPVVAQGTSLSPADVVGMLVLSADHL